MTRADAAFVSTGSLPGPAEVARLVEEAYRRFAPIRTGEVSDVYPALRTADPDRFGIAVTGVTGATHAAGDSTVPFSIMSVAKPFVFALACAALGPDEVRDRIGVNATGLPFNALSAVERSLDGRTNPMVNPGAIAVTSLVPGADVERKWRSLERGLARFAGRALSLDDEILRSARASNHRNRSLAQLLQSQDRLGSDASEAVDLYTRQSCLRVTARDLAVMGATLANAGINPLTHERVVEPETCHCTLAVMITAGLYETSGDWLYDIGLPGKSGIGGGIVAVSPGKGALGTFAPPLDEAGNSVKGQLVARFLSRRIGLDLLVSKSEG